MGSVDPDDNETPDDNQTSPDVLSDAEWDEFLAEMDPRVAGTFRRWEDEEGRSRGERARRKRLTDFVRPLARRRSRRDEFSDEGAAPPLSVRLPRWLDEQVRREFERIGVRPSEALRQILEEWWVTRRFPALEYRDATFLRVAAIRGGPGTAEWAANPRRYQLDPLAEEQAADYTMLARIRIEAAASLEGSAR